MEKRGSESLRQALFAATMLVATAFALLDASPADAGIGTIAPPPGARVVSFDDVDPAPTSFGATIALRTRYAARGIVFSGPGNDGGAILSEAAGFSVTGYSAPNFLAFNSSATLQGGGKAQLPETLLFRHPVRHVQFNVADTSQLQVTAEAFDSDGNSLDSATIGTLSAMQTVVLEARHIARVVISGGGLETAIDDVAFVLDSTVVDFDDVLSAPDVFLATTALRTQYAGKGVVFASAQQNDGGAILNETSEFGVTGHSSPNFLAFNTASTLIDGGKPVMPQYLQFNPPVRRVRFLVGSVVGTTIEATAFTSNVEEVDSAFIATTPAMQEIVLDGDAISNVEITMDGQAVVIDDLEFETDATVIDFDDDTNPANIFNEATALRERYAALGMHFEAPGNDGAAVLAVNPGLGVLGYSGSNVLMVDAGDQLANGGTPKFPETIRFDRPQKRVEIRVADPLGSRIFFEARDAAGEITATTDIFGTAKFQNVFLYFDGTTELKITSNGTRAIMDDLAFTPMDECEHDPCYQGPALTRHCDACVTKICAADSDCCNDGWDGSCALAVDATCEIQCKPLCGDANQDRKIASGDALAALRTAVGNGTCPKFLCDFNGDNKIASGDALAILRTSVQLLSTPKCPPAS